MRWKRAGAEGVAWRAGLVGLALAWAALAGLGGGALAGSPSKANKFLQMQMDRFHKGLDVYTDIGAAGNHFVVAGKMPADGAVGMDDGCTVNPRSGATCIECSFTASGDNWGGFYRLNGVLRGAEAQPRANWGEEPDAGLDLRGASEVTFWARGALGGERVEFFVGGIGWGTDWQGNSTWPIMPFFESFPKVSIGYITLPAKWKMYKIKLKGWDLSYVLGGFGWVTSAARNGNRSIRFYVDDIQWAKAPQNDLRLIVSHETGPTQDAFDLGLRSVAFTYDNALALLAFLAQGKKDDLRRARILADSLAYAAEHDRFYSDYRLRNAYSGGALVAFPGWTPNGREATARLPRLWHAVAEEWYENEYHAGTATGNVAWAVIALLAAHARLGDARYRDVAVKLGEWLEAHCRDARGAGGYKGGYSGGEPAPGPLMWKSTEHNLDAYVAFMRLFDATGGPSWLERALHARAFVEAMWDDSEGKFWTGTGTDGVTVNEGVVPLDVQAWAVLAFWDNPALYARALAFAELNHAVGGGFDYDTDRDGIWYEGTAQMAAAYRALGQAAKERAAIAVVAASQLASGAIPAASKDELTTGFDSFYYRRGHVGATAWYILAALGANPFWLR